MSKIQAIINEQFCDMIQRFPDLKKDFSYKSFISHLWDGRPGSIRQ